MSARSGLKDLGTVHRPGFEAMGIVGDGVWGEPADRKAATVMMPIPGTGSIQHLEENVAAAGVVLDDTTFAELEAAR